MTQTMDDTMSGARREMVCPCCGGQMDAELGRCECGARLVGEPVLHPAVPQPLLGRAFVAVGLAVISIIGFWFKPLLAVGIVAVIVALRAIRSAKRDPEAYGGLRTARTGLVLASIVTLGVGGILVARIPRAIKNRQQASEAATRSEMYHVAGLVAKYRTVYGRYPDKLVDLDRVEGIDTIPDARDAWEQRIVYAGYTSGIASVSGVPALNANYELRSPGADGLSNTPDDIVMRDGTIADPSHASVAPAPTILVKNPASKRPR